MFPTVVPARGMFPARRLCSAVRTSRWESLPFNASRLASAYMVKYWGSAGIKILSSVSCCSTANVTCVTIASYKSSKAFSNVSPYPIRLISRAIAHQEASIFLYAKHVEIQFQFQVHCLPLHARLTGVGTLPSTRGGRRPGWVRRGGRTAAQRRDYEPLAASPPELPSLEGWPQAGVGTPLLGGVAEGRGGFLFGQRSTARRRNPPRRYAAQRGDGESICLLIEDIWGELDRIAGSCTIVYVL